jgi:hypothetical protein
MENDKFTKVVLTAIAVLLFVSVAQNAGWICDGQGKKNVCSAERRAQCKAKAQGDSQNYRLLPLTQSRKVLRIEGDTGRVWSLDMRGMKGWRPIETLTDEEIAEIEEARSAARPAQQGRQG